MGQHTSFFVMRFVVFNYYGIKIAKICYINWV